MKDSCYHNLGEHHKVRGKNKNTQRIRKETLTQYVGPRQKCHNDFSHIQPQKIEWPSWENLHPCGFPISWCILPWCLANSSVAKPTWAIHDCGYCGNRTRIDVRIRDSKGQKKGWPWSVMVFLSGTRQVATIANNGTLEMQSATGWHKPTKRHMVTCTGLGRGICPWPEKLKVNGFAHTWRTFV